MTLKIVVIELVIFFFAILIQLCVEKGELLALNKYEDKLNLLSKCVICYKFTTYYSLISFLEVNKFNRNTIKLD